jgi:multidrug efflux pump subunit AcrB
LNALSRVAAQIDQLMKSTAGTRDVLNPLRLQRTDLRLKVDSQKLAMLGVSRLDLNRAVRLAVSGANAGEFKDPNGEQYDIVVRTPMQGRPSVESLQNVRVPNSTGALLPLTQLAGVEFAASPTEISRYNRQRDVTLTAYAQSGFNTDQVTQAIRTKLDRLDWPRGYRYMLAGEIESREESLGGMGTAILIAIFGIFCVLVLEFGNFKSVLIVLTVIPLGAFGGLLALFASGNALSFTATIGFIALIGIEIKNSILLVDFTNQLRAAGWELDEAIEHGGEVRFLPILLTSATAIGGLLPLALQNSAFYSPMAWVIIGGLASSTVLARIVTPVMYKLIPPDINKVM